VGNKGKRQLCLTVDQEVYAELERLRDETGLPLSSIAQLRMRGYDIRKMSEEDK